MISCMDYGRYKDKGGNRKTWNKQAEALKQMDDVLMPVGDGTHKMMSHVKPKTNMLYIMDSYNQDRM